VRLLLILIVITIVVTVCLAYVQEVKNPFLTSGDVQLQPGDLTLVTWLNPLSHPSVKIVRDGQAKAETQDVPKYKVFERIIINDKPYENKFRDVILTAVFTSPSGKKTTFWGFYDGDGKGGQTGNVWKLRFMPDEVGTWKYTYSWSDGTAGGSGTFRCVSAGAGKGVLKPYVKNPRWVAYNGVEPVFLRSYYVGKLTHTSLDWSIKHVYQPLIDRGYNHIQYLGTLFGWMTNKFEDAPDPAITHGTGHGSKQNLDAWKLVESHFMWLNDRNIAVHHWTGLANAYAYRHGGIDWRWQDMSPAEREIHIRYIMSRLAPLANQAGWGFWFETGAPADFMKLVAKYDPWDHLRGHQGHYNDLNDSRRSVRPEETWVNVSFPGKYSRDSAVVHKLIKDYYEKEIGNDYTPLVLNESGLWAVKGVAQQADKLRRAAWGVTTANAYFVWRWVTSGSRSAPAQAASQMFATPAAKYMEVLYDVMSNEVEFGEMRSHDELLIDAPETTFCLAEIGRQYLVYDEEGGSFSLKVARQTYDATWIDTKTGKKTYAGTVKGTGSAMKFTTPDTNTDWVLVLRARQ